MTPNAASLRVHFDAQSACIKVIGRANFNLAVDFKRLLALLQQKNCATFRIDLSECALMDSTFLGVLSGFGLRMSQPAGEPATRLVELFNPNERVGELLENLGVLHLFKVAHGTATPVTSTGDKLCEPGEATREEVTKTCLEAHQKLVEINPENEDRFRDVTKFLAEDLKRLKEKP